MVRKGTWVLLLVLLALVGFSIYLQQQKESELAAPTPTSWIVPLFSDKAEGPSAIRIENAAGDAVELSRADDGQWVLEAPSKTPADQAAAQAAATQAGALQSLSTVKLAPAIVGLDRPAYTLTIGFGATESHALLVGSITPIQDGYYAQLDGGDYLVVDKNGLEELIGLLRAPPYQATPTPVASVTPPASPTTLPESSTPAGEAATQTVSP